MAIFGRSSAKTSKPLKKFGANGASKVNKTKSAGNGKSSPDEKPPKAIFGRSSSPEKPPKKVLGRSSSESKRPKKKVSGRSSSESRRPKKKVSRRSSSEKPPAKKIKSDGETKTVKKAWSVDQATKTVEAPTPNGVSYMLFQQRSKAAEGLAVASARMQERLIHAKLWVAYRSATLVHPWDPLRIRSAKVYKDHMERQATETRMQKVALAHCKCNEEQTRYVEKMIARAYDEHAKTVQKATEARKKQISKNATFLEKNMK